MTTPKVFLHNLDLSKIDEQQRQQQKKMVVKTTKKPKKISNKRKTSTNNNDIVPFPFRCFDMLEEVERAGLEHIVSWNSDGISFKVHDVTKFVNQILPCHFKQTKYKSFQRQMNFYGFLRTLKGPLQGSYQHPSFRKGRPDLVKEINRITTTSASSASKKKKTKTKTSSTTTTTDDSSSSSSSSECSTHDNSLDEIVATVTMNATSQDEKKETMNDHDFVDTTAATSNCVGIPERIRNKESRFNNNFKSYDVSFEAVQDDQDNHDAAIDPEPLMMDETQLIRGITAELGRVAAATQLQRSTTADESRIATQLRRGTTVEGSRVSFLGGKNFHFSELGMSMVDF